MDAKQAQTILNELRKAFMENKALTIATIGKTPFTVIPLALKTDEKGNNPALSFCFPDNLSMAAIAPLENISSAIINKNIDVPLEVQKGKDYWESRFFSYSPNTLNGTSELSDSFKSQFDQHNVPAFTNTSIDSSFNASSAKSDYGFTEENTASVTPEEKTFDVTSKPAYNPYSPNQPVKKSKTGIIIGVATAVAITIIVGGVVVIGTNSDKIRENGATEVSSSESNDNYEVAAAKWAKETDTSKYLSSKTDPFLIADSPAVTDYDRFSIKTPHLAEVDANSNAEDTFPEGWEINYSPEEEVFPIPKQAEEYGTWLTYWDSSEYNVMSYESILSKTAIKALGKTDEEATINLMKSMVPNASEPFASKIYLRGSRTGYVEFYEFTYKDEKGRVVHYALRVFTGNGKVFAFANNHDWATETYQNNGFVFEMYAYPWYPRPTEMQPE